MSELNMLQAAAASNLNEMAVEGAKQGFFSTAVEGVKSVVADNPIAVAVGVTGLVVGGVMYYGYRNWGWFSDEAVDQEKMYTREELDAIVASMVAPTPVAPAPVAPAPVAPAAPATVVPVATVV